MTALLLGEKGDVVLASLNESKIADAEAVQQLESELSAAMLQAAAGRKLLVDFSRVQFISSMTIGLIVRLHSQCKRKEIRLKLCGLSPALAEAFKLSGLSKVLDIQPDETTALAAFGPSGPEWEA